MAATALVTRPLTERLERLRGPDAACCLSDYRSLALAVRAEPTFAAALARAKARADAQRLVVLGMLRREGEMCACEIQAALGLGHPTVSHHMSLLVGAGLVRARRTGKWMYYRLAPGAEKGVP